MAAEHEQSAPEVIEDDPREVRLSKREALIAAGEEPYGRNYPVDVHVVDLEAEYAKLAEMYGVSADAVKGFFAADSIRSDIVCEKAINVVKDAAVITEPKEEDTNGEAAQAAE